MEKETVQMIQTIQTIDESYDEIFKKIVIDHYEKLKIKKDIKDESIFISNIFREFYENTISKNITKKDSFIIPSFYDGKIKKQFKIGEFEIDFYFDLKRNTLSIKDRGLRIDFSHFLYVVSNFSEILSSSPFVFSFSWGSTGINESIGLANSNYYYFSGDLIYLDKEISVKGIREVITTRYTKKIFDVLFEYIPNTNLNDFTSFANYKDSSGINYFLSIDFENKKKATIPEKAIESKPEIKKDKMPRIPPQFKKMMEDYIKEEDGW